MLSQLIFSYFGDSFIKTLAETDTLIGQSYTIVCSITLISCGPFVHFHKSLARLCVLVDEFIFNFILAFGNSSTIGFLVTPTLMQFIENIYIYCMDLWTSLLCSIGKDQTLLNSTSVVLIWAGFETVGSLCRCKQVHVKVLALANPLRCPFGINFWRCHECQLGMQYLKFNSQETVHSGNEWTKTKVRYVCSGCGHQQRNIKCPQWIKAV
ncbi:hypothetical protein HD554DRAFT_2010470 [Boletus coccyginus]|nr:hypothetical protein HD554DRAFT_2010470 [Boletus coccyginus]